MEPRIRLVLRIVEEQKASIRLSLLEASKILRVSEPHLLRLFHREVGKTFRQYLRDARMINAAELVKANAQSPKEIADHFGYSDVSNFYRDFKSVHGMTPRQMWLMKLVELDIAINRADRQSDVVPPHLPQGIDFSTD